ncbi:MAG: response regulator [Pirellula sp.]|jgi:hypothetical protein|nr:response regulator [Pirellula sp.]
MAAIQRRIGWVGPQNKCWAWILDRLPAVDHLSSLKDWKLESADDLLMVALESRLAPEWDEISAALPTSLSVEAGLSSQLKKSRKKNDAISSSLDSSVCVLLGEPWVGHRRTQPIPESLNTFYWYELYDRLLPSLDLGIGRTDVHSPEKGQRIARWHSVAEKLAQIEVSGKRVLVVADSSTTHSMWCESFENRYASVLGVDSEQLHRFRFQPHMVLIDHEAGPPMADEHASERHCQRVLDTLQHVRNRFPEAMTVVASGFPRWVDWERWSLGGADVLVPKPGCLLGLAWGIHRWEQMQLAE